jgi:uncharacterized RmlC-like cupin family protein
MPADVDGTQFITRYKSIEDRSKPKRVLDTIKVGDTYVSRLSMDADAVAGNMYHKKTNVILFVTKGFARFKFVDIKTNAAEEFEAGPEFGIVHQPPGSALAIKNICMGETVIFFFSNEPLRKDDDYAYPIYDSMSGMPLQMKKKTDSLTRINVKPMTHYPFKQDRRKLGRLLEYVKVGDVWVSRLTVDVGVITGNIFHKKTNILLFVTQGKFKFKFVHVKTKESKEFDMEPGRGLLHIPKNISIANKNTGSEKAVIIYFSNNPFRDNDDFEYKIY